MRFSPRIPLGHFLRVTFNKYRAAFQNSGANVSKRETVTTECDSADCTHDRETQTKELGRQGEGPTVPRANGCTITRLHRPAGLPRVALLCPWVARYMSPITPIFTIFQYHDGWIQCISFPRDWHSISRDSRSRFTSSQSE